MGVVFEPALKPPATVLLICLLAFVCSTLIMAVYMQHAEYVPNLEVSRTWEKFLQDLSEIELCAKVSDSEDLGSSKIFENTKSTEDAPKITNEVISLTVFANISFLKEVVPLPPGPIVISGQIPGRSWAPLCYEIEENSMLNISFIYPEDVTPSGNKQICVILTGPPSLVPLSKPSSMCVPPFVNMSLAKQATITGGISKTIFNIMQKSPEQCENGTLVQLKYDTATEHIVYLSKAEKNRITWNLEIVSGCLLILCMLFIIQRFVVGRKSVVLEDDTYESVSQLT